MRGVSTKNYRVSGISSQYTDVNCFFLISPVFDLAFNEPHIKTTKFLFLLTLRSLGHQEGMVTVNLFLFHV